MNKILARKIRDSRNITKGSLIFIEIYQLVDKENHDKFKNRNYVFSWYN